jgi:branched-chain amino acid transport system substrate-binding protein
MVFREVNGLPLGSVKSVIDAYGELVDEGCLVIFGPSTTDNAVPTREAIENRYKVPAVSVTGTDDWLGEWTFSFPMGSLTDEPIFWADLLAKAGHVQVGVLTEQSLIGETYLQYFRNAARRKRIRIVAEESIQQTAQDITAAVRRLRDANAQAIVHCGFGFGIVNINPALAAQNWDPPRYTGTAFQNAWINPVMWNALLGWTGIDQYDEANPVGQRFLDQYQQAYTHRPEYCIPVVNRDIANTLLQRPGRRTSLESTRRHGSPRALQNAARRRRRTRHPDLIRKMDAPRLDGRRLPRRPTTRSGRHQLPPRRPLR